MQNFFICVCREKREVRVERDASKFDKDKHDQTATFKALAFCTGLKD